MDDKKSATFILRGIWRSKSGQPQFAQSCYNCIPNVQGIWYHMYKIKSEKSYCVVTLANILPGEIAIQSAKYFPAQHNQIQ